MKKQVWIYSACAVGLAIAASAAILKTHSSALNAVLAIEKASTRPDREIIAGLSQPYLGVLSSMYAREPQVGTDGAKHPLSKDTGVWASDGMYIYNLCKTVRPERTLEVGLAEGYSTVFFLAALQENGRGTHTAIDPFEKSDWNGIGVHKVEELGLQQRFRFMEAKSIYAMPQLGMEGKLFQIIFIDGDHRYDAQMLDFSLADNILERDGYLLFHDTWMPSTRKLVAFILKNRPDYKSIPTGTNLAVFQKIGADKRDWQSFTEF
jgi:predicted O-methyltransferase YrrM